MLGLGTAVPFQPFAGGVSVTEQLRNLLFGEGQQGLFFVPQPVLDGKQVLYTTNIGTIEVDAGGDPAGLGLEWSGDLVGYRGGINYVVNSESLAASDWAKIRVAVNDVAEPDLSVVSGASYFVPDTSAATHFVNQSVLNTSDAISASLYVKVDSAIDKVTLYPGSSLTFAHFNMANLTTSKESNVTSNSIEDVGNGYYLLKASWPEGATYDRMRAYASSGSFGSSPEASDGVAGIFMTGIQFERGVEVTQYQPATPFWHSQLPGNHLTQPTSADRPTYGTDGSLHWLASDGTGDNLKTTYASAVTQPCTLSIAIDKQDAGSDKVIVTGLGSADRHQLSINASGNLVAIAGGTTLDSAAGLANGKHVVTAVIDGANSSIRVDGVVVATGDLGSASSGGLTLSALWDGTLSIIQDAYGIVHVEGVGDIDTIESYLAQRIGISL